MRRWTRPGVRVARPAFYAGSAAVIAWAAIAVPLPVIEQVPGAPIAIPPLIEIDGAELTELDGTTALLVILNRQRTVTGSVGALFDGDRTLRPYQEIYPEDVDRTTYLAEQRDRFTRQFDVAAAVGAAAAGITTELVTEVVVVDVLPGSPADGLLVRGDVVVAVDGAPLASAEQLQALTRAAAIGDRLALTVRTGGADRIVDVTLADVTGDGQARLGVAIETAVDEVRLPFTVALREGTRIGGPSAGMMIALTVYDLLAEEDLLDGRTVVGTGTVDVDGRIGPVGGIPHKLRAARDHGADVVLVPAVQGQLALETAPAGLTVVPVATFDEALAALR